MSGTTVWNHLLGEKYVIDDLRIFHIKMFFIDIFASRSSLFNPFEQEDETQHVVAFGICASSKFLCLQIVVNVASVMVLDVASVCWV